MFYPGLRYHCRLLGLALSSFAFSSTGIQAIDYTRERAEVQALGNLSQPPKVYEAEGLDGGGTIRAIYYDALPWKGKPTRAFAWLGVPENGNGKLPGIVLVHGGGGTAFRTWVEKWNTAGFAAISIATEGQIDRREADNPREWIQHDAAGPKRLGIFEDSGEPLKDQWMYHAVADTILANSLLRSLPQVDADRVGLAGISWGGVITSTVIGIDDRFAFAIPTYGCGHLFDAENHWGRALGDNLVYREIWDPMQRMNRVKMPVLWLSWPGDQHFPLDCLSACYTATAGPRMISLIPGMGHSHPKGWDPPDSYAFAQSIIETGQAWVRQTGLDQSGNAVSVSFASTRSLERAELVSTSDTGFTGERKWAQTPASLDKRNDTWTAKALLPEGTTAWFINAYSEGLTVSSTYQETGQP